MAEIKNSFLRSKMNKDLDDRLIPNGEYRDAQNISVGKSEADDIGALETVLGNTLVTNFGLSGVETIGYKTIENTNQIIVFLTDNTNHYIYSYIPNTTPVLLVTGSFLNFSTNSPITGISVIENLLFWTDNRNQPRKINLNSTNNGAYYTEENHISVAKYNPYQPIGLLSKTSKITSGLVGDILTVPNTTGIVKGMSVVDYSNNTLGPEDYVYVLDIPSSTTIQLKIPIGHTITGVTSGDTIYFLQTTMTGESITFDFNQGNTWPGDPDYLESKLVRLSYRFKFDDGEYSLMAPFTQIAFIPKQKGYFLGSGESTPGAGDQTAEDEDSAYRSTIVEFMENGVQNIKLLIPFPDTLNKIQPSSEASYKIRSIDILYKESDGLAVKVIDTIDYDEPFNETNGDAWTATTDTNILTYNYQSRKPFRTLPTAQTTRVYDKVPVKALAQETAGNRIIYGNFLDKYTSPRFLEYIIGVGPKSLAKNYDNWAEYPNHTVKQNRNYQVGFVLVDKFGRQSDVILSGVKTQATVAVDGTVYGGDTIYNPYNSSVSDLKNWFGDALKIDISSPITVAKNDVVGTPGLYANPGTGYNTYNATPGNQPVINGNTYTFTLGSGQTQVPTIGSFLEGEFTDYVKVANVTNVNNDYTITTIGQVSSIYLQQSPSDPDVKYKYTINPTGWYSYKVVVKQQEQDYYNCYLPGFLNGYPQFQSGSNPFPPGEDNKTAHTVLINDNINKIPRDLSEVGPQQKQFRSSVQLFGRVENTLIVSSPPTTDDPKNNRQFFPGVNTDTAITIGTATDLNMSYSDLKEPQGHDNFYQLDTDPLIARISTSQPIGLIHTNDDNTNMYYNLSIYETEPQDSLLDIFWETPTVGLISTLNDAILSEYEGAVGWSTYSSSGFTESMSGDFITGLSPVDQSGNNLFNTSASAITVLDGADNDVSGQFSITRTGAGTLGDPYLYNFGKIGDEFVYNYNPNPRSYTISAVITNNEPVSPVTNPTPLQLNVFLQNTQPIINSGNPLPAVNDVNQNFEGTIVTITGENGAASSSRKSEQLKWSISNVSPSLYAGVFSINETTGVITKTGTGTNPGTCTLTVKLEDAYNGSALASGSLSQTATQEIGIVSAVIGTLFEASAPSVFSQACHFSGSSNPTCGDNLYYNQTSSTPTVGDEIRQGPNGSSSPLAVAGYYSYNCNNTGSGNRNYFQIQGNDGIIDVVSTC
jgi:hypothetical protein